MLFSKNLQCPQYYLISLLIDCIKEEINFAREFSLYLKKRENYDKKKF